MVAQNGKSEPSSSEEGVLMERDPSMESWNLNEIDLRIKYIKRNSHHMY